MLFFVVFSHSEKNCFAFMSDRQIKTFHCSHNYSKSEFLIKNNYFFLLKASLLLQTCNNTRKCPTYSVFLLFLRAMTIDNPFRISLLDYNIASEFV